MGCDLKAGPLTTQFDEFVTVNLDGGLPDFGSQKFNYILLLDVIEHLRSPEDFLDQLRKVAAACDAEVIPTTANIGFVFMRLSLMLGRFEYGKRGILDLTHARLFTFATMRRTLAAAGFDVIASEGVVLSLPFVLGNSRIAKFLMRINKALTRLWPTMFGFQILLRAKARPMLDQLLRDAHSAADEKLRSAFQQIGTAA